MKIAMETLQTKFEDKEREKAKLKNEYKQYIAELKLDKKRYIELLELRDYEMKRMSEQVRKFEEEEHKYKGMLHKMEI